MSIDAVVIARRKGGVSSTLAGAALGIVTMRLSVMKRPSASSSAWVVDSSVSGRRMIGLE